MNPGAYPMVRSMFVLALMAGFVACAGSEQTERMPEAGGDSGAVAVDGGMVAGASARGDGAVRMYGSIPYAAPPTGERRWLPPQPVEPWEGVRDGSQLPPACVQVILPVPPGEDPYFGPGATHMDEDCLYLNVWSAAAPADAAPVLVWIHGGALRMGDGSSVAFDGSALASRGVVVVTLNYRLGALGYLAHPLLRAESANEASGNYGLLDQVAALEWVQRNIAAFGGDPQRVTIFGESAGSWSINYLMATPSARSLFAGAIGQSGGVFAPGAGAVPRPTAESAGEQFAATVLGEDADVSLEALRALPADDVVAAATGRVLVNIDGWVLPAGVNDIFANGAQHDVPVILGSNADENTALARYAQGPRPGSVAEYEEWAHQEYGDLADQYLAAYPAESDADVEARIIDSGGDGRFVWEMRAWARMMETVTSPAFVYHFTRVPPAADAARYGAYHTAEIPYVFGNLDGGGRYWFANRDYDDTDRRLSDAMSSYWINFAATGDPNGAGLPEWPAYSLETEPALELGDTVQVRHGVRGDRLDFFDQLYAARRAATN